MDSVLSSLVVLLLLYVVQRFLKFYKKLRHLEKFGLPKDNHWFFGQSLIPIPTEEGIAWSSNQVKQFRKCASFRLGPMRHSISVFHPDTVKPILKSTEPKDNATLYRFLLPWLGDGLLISSGQKWYRNRRLITPAFHFGILKPYIEVFNKSADKLCSQLKKLSTDGSSVEIFSPVSCATLDAILQCAFSKNEQSLQEEGKKHPYVEAVTRTSEIFSNRILNPLKHLNIVFWNLPSGLEFKKHCKYLHRTSEEVIRDRRQQLAKDPSLLEEKKRLDFLDILLTARDEDGKGLSDMDIRNEVDTFMFEGHDTTASAISWVLKEMASNPGHAEQCRSEVLDLVKDRPNTDLTWEDMNALPHTTKCIKETLRLHSPVPVVSRVLEKDMELDGKVAPAGTPVDLLLFAMHTNPHVWGEDCLEFKPERFDPENFAKLDPFAFCPFAAGPRNCIGQNFAMNEIKVVVAKVLVRFNLALDPARKPRRVHYVVVRAENGLYLKLTTR